MSHTNKTQYYNLPQFIGTDVPAWLTDVNQGYAAIDAGMRAAQVKADNADQTAGQAANDVQALSSTVTTQASQISAAAQAASSAQTTANGADAKADTNAQAISGLDTRVTALEQGGTGGTIVKETLTITQGSSVEIPDKVGYVPISAVVLSLSTPGINHYGCTAEIDFVRGIGSFTTDYAAYIFTISAQGIHTLTTGDYTIMVTYEKIS